MRITVVGGGNIGTQFMVHCAEKGHEVIAYTSCPEQFFNPLEIVNEDGIITHSGNIVLATKDPICAFSEAEMILVTYPATMMDQIAGGVYQYGNPSAFIGVVPGYGGGECAFKDCIERGNVFFALERVPAIARLVEKGKRVKSVGYRNELHIASIPADKAEKCCDIIEGIFDMPCKKIPCFLNLTLTPSNPILHTTRLRTIFKDYKQGIMYDRLPLFYEDWDDESSELLIACDTEVQNICKALPEFRLDGVLSLRVHYESPTVQDMTKKISCIKAFKGIETPSVKVNGKLIPDLHSRYFTSDFSFGLSIIRQVAEYAGVSVPNIEDTLKWYENIAIESKRFRYSDYGIYNKTEFSHFYLR